MVRIGKFRDKEFIDREQEIKYLKQRFEKTPDEILWLYGPKSTGKTTLIEYVIEKELTNSLKLFDKYWIKYINFRGLMVGSYDSFVNSFFEEAEDEDDFSSEIVSGFNIGVIKLEAKILEKIKSNKKNLFNLLIEKLKTIKKRKIIVIDEIQTLQDIYYNGEKELLKEFLNFCVRLTKELHLAHVVILSSNTVFIEQIYNDAKLKVTSRFKKIDHLDFEVVNEWLLSKDLGFSSDDIKLIWDYLGGCIPLIQRMINEKYQYNSLKEYLDSEVELAISEIKHIFIMEMEHNDIELFKKIAKKIVENSFYKLDEKDSKEVIKIINFMSENEILFYDPLSQIIRGNNRLYEKAFEKILKK